ERLRADLAARDVEIQRLKTEVAQAQEKAAAARARESGYREQIDRLESRISQVGCPANRQTDENGDRDSRILALSGLSEVKVSETLKAEGIKCSPRTVGNVRRRHRAERPEAAGPVTSSAAGVNRSVQTIKK
ncbi:hypothetical protein, partial [Thiocystis violacea]|uniref:hypothetical protein n=1 Tax=Thiocystis violacea TaxID=13725 RepID=UPI0019033965